MMMNLMLLQCLHTYNLSNFLYDVSRVLKNNGIFISQTSNIIFNIPFEILKQKSFSKYKKYHISLQSYWSLKKY